MSSTVVEPRVTEQRDPAGQPPVHTYRAAVVHDFQEALVVEQVTAAAVQAGQVGVKVEATGLCHTDIHAAHGDWPVKPSPPVVPGHERVGIVVEVAPGVTEVAVGDRVGMPWRRVRRRLWPQRRQGARRGRLVRRRSAHLRRRHDLLNGLHRPSPNELPDDTCLLAARIT